MKTKLLLTTLLCLIFATTKTFAITFLNHTSSDIKLTFPQRGIAVLCGSPDARFVTKLAMPDNQLALNNLKNAIIKINGTDHIASLDYRQNFLIDEISIHQDINGYFFLKITIQNQIYDISLLQKQELSIQRLLLNPDFFDDGYLADVSEEE